MSDRPAEIGVVLVGGSRSHQENYAAAFAAEGCRLLSVGLAGGLDEDEAGRHGELARTLGIPLLPLGEALRLPGANVASVCVSMPHRAAIASACAAAGLHLYLDKPLAGSAADAASIAEAVARAGVHAQVFSHVTTAWARRARDAVRGGHLGRIIAVHADMLMAKGVPAAIPAAPRVESPHPADYPEDIAKREMTDMGIYPVSLVAWLLGTRALTVNAATANHFFAEHLERNVEDYGAMLLEFEGGVTATITCGRTGWHSHHAPFLSRVIIVGTEGTLMFGNDQNELVLTTSRGVDRPQANSIDPMNMWLSTPKTSLPRPVGRNISLDPARPWDVAAFVAGLTAGGEMGIGAEQAAHHCEILAAAYCSAAQGCAVNVPGR
jgi:myo-inositol 2-dehydrogenase / D-chiro-inositol 1-dehydrogenase